MEAWGMEARGMDVNADVGEFPEALARDEALAAWVTTLNIACGGHAGDDATMRRLVEVARMRGRTVCAHPGYPDRAGFGRVDWAGGAGGEGGKGGMTAREVEECVAEQVARLAAHARAAGVGVGRVKPHGALYHRACRDEEIAWAVVRATERVLGGQGDVGTGAALVLAAVPEGAGGAGGAGEGEREWSRGVVALKAAGCVVVAEGFADRAYGRDGRLLPRDREGAVLASTEAIVAQAVGLAREGGVRAADGSWVRLACETVCLHGDTPDVVEHAMAVVMALVKV